MGGAKILVSAEDVGDYIARVGGRSFVYPCSDVVGVVSDDRPERIHLVRGWVHPKPTPIPRLKEWESFTRPVGPLPRFGKG